MATATASMASDMGSLGPMILRLFCACGADNHCRCGRDKPASGWTVAALEDLRDLMREHQSLFTVAALTGRTRRECNVALDALLCRTPTHALAVLEAQALAKARARP